MDVAKGQTTPGLGNAEHNREPNANAPWSVNLGWMCSLTGDRRQLVSSRKPDNIPAFNRVILELLGNDAGR